MDNNILSEVIDVEWEIQKGLEVQNFWDVVTYVAKQLISPLEAENIATCRATPA